MESPANDSQPSWGVTPETIQEAVRRIVETAHPAKIILFGSQARGDGLIDSDLDLLVIEDGVKDTLGESGRLHRALRGLLIAADILVVDRVKFEYWQDTPGNVYYEATQDGRTLYEAA